MREVKESGRKEEEGGGKNGKKSDPSVAKLSTTSCMLKTKRGEKMYTEKQTHVEVRMTCGREIERLALCSANSQIVLRRSKAECDREGLHTPLFYFFNIFLICLKLPLTLPCFV